MRYRASAQRRVLFNYLFLNNIISRLCLLPVTTPLRATTLPAVPAIVQAGLPDFEAMAWFGMLAPANTPRESVTRLNGEIIKAMKLADVRERLLALGAEPVGNTPEQFARICKKKSPSGRVSLKRQRRGRIDTLARSKNPRIHGLNIRECRGLTRCRYTPG